MTIVRVKPKLLISIWTVDEVPEVIDSDADIIDVKDPSTGSLGLPSLNVVLSVVNSVRNYKEISVAIGDVRDYSHTLSYIAYALSLLNVNYIKIGIEMDNYDKALSTISQIRRTITYCNSKTDIVLVGYADWKGIGTLEPLKVIDLARVTKVQGVMIDTRIKDGTSTFDHIPLQYLEEFVVNAHRSGLYTAIAGGLRAEHIPICISLGFDVIGVRTAACSGNRLGRVSREAINTLKMTIEKHWNKLCTS